MSKISKPKILILGAGALGSHVTLNLIADIPEVELTVLDFDRVEPRNLRAGTQAYEPEQEGQLKVDALQLLVYSKFDKDILTHDVRLDKATLNLLDGYGLIVDCFDNVYSRGLVKKEATKKGYEILHAGFSGLKTFQIGWNENYEVSDKDLGIDVCEMPGARSFIQGVASLTSLVIQQYLEKGEKLEGFGNLLRPHFDVAS